MKPEPLAVTERPHRGPRKTKRGFQLTRHRRTFLRQLAAGTYVLERAQERRTARALQKQGYVEISDKVVWATSKGLAVAQHKYTRVAMGKIVNGKNAIRWALQEYGRDSDSNWSDGEIVIFLESFQDGSVVTGEEWSEYRYWCTGEHE